jgi:uncharacterized protein YvpB
MNLSLSRRSLIAASLLTSSFFVTTPLLAQQASVKLPVPYASQVPDGAWVAPWDEACEEASLLMVNGYYQKKTNLPKSEVKREIQRMVNWEKATFSTYTDTDAEQTVRLIEEHSSFKASVQRSPSLEKIKEELSAGRPVIILVDMFELYNEPDLGDSYHVAVLSGYDDAKQEFHLLDPAREATAYSYDQIMNALHDFNPNSGEADKEATVLFTEGPIAQNRPWYIAFFSFFKRIFS